MKNKDTRGIFDMTLHVTALAIHILPSSFNAVKNSDRLYKHYTVSYSKGHKTSL